MKTEAKIGALCSKGKESLELPETVKRQEKIFPTQHPIAITHEFYTAHSIAYD